MTLPEFLWNTFRLVLFILLIAHLGWSWWLLVLFILVIEISWS